VLEIGQNFPVSEYYKGRVIDAETISRSGLWWTAVLLLSDPKTEQPLIACYRWQRSGNDWKTRNRFYCKNKKDAARILDILTRFSAKLP